MLGRVATVAMIAIVVPLALGLLSGVLAHLEMVESSGATAGRWLVWGVWTYTGIHAILYRPTALFRAQHRLFSLLTAWLFGGQVASVEQTGGRGQEAKRGAKAAKRGRGARSDAAASGSTLVAFSPYVIPLYTVLLSALAWLLRRWVDSSAISSPAAFGAGVTIAFHWLMTADDLQAQREQWHVETYLLAVGLIAVLSVLISAACLPLAVPEFSFVQALSEGMSLARSIYSTIIGRLFL